MRSNNLKRHMKVHITYTNEDLTENSEEICSDIVMEMVDKMFVGDESATERNHDGEHYTTNCTTAKRKHNDNDTYDQPIIKIKLGEDEIDLDALRKSMEEQTAEHDCILALGKGVDTILGEGKVKQTALSKDLQNALELYRNEDEDYDLYKDSVLYPWQEELLKHMNPTHRQVIWVVGEKTDEGKSSFQKYIKAGKKKIKPKFSVGDSVRIYKERGTFHRGYMEDFTTEIFSIVEVLLNLPVPRYKIKEYNGDEVVGSFFEDELVRYDPPEFYEIDVITALNKESAFSVHKVRYSNSVP